MSFIGVEDRVKWAGVLAGRGLSLDVADRAIEERLVPTYADGPNRVVWEGDIKGIPVDWKPVAAPGCLPFIGGVESRRGGAQWRALRFRNGICVTLPPAESLRGVSSIGPALRKVAQMQATDASAIPMDFDWIGGSRVSVPGADLAARMQEMGTRVARVTGDRTSELTKSAYYMGSKYALASFLVEGIADVLPADGVVVDLMCGAGAAARAFSHCWDVWACDAMHFCTNLATSVGYDRASEQLTQHISDVHRFFRENMNRLERIYAGLLSEEEALLHSPIGFDEGLREQYALFIDRTPRFPEGGLLGTWSIVDEIVARRRGRPEERLPYCLVVSYFGNVYFGLRQAMEIDSIRYAIDRLGNHSRESMLAALVGTASYLGTGYASQFAQPLKVGALGRERFLSLLERRSIRVFPEFAARVAALAAVAGETVHPIRALTGPWEWTLGEIDRLGLERPVCVYLDAPYTRDEYARYYHVLETICRYHYPDAVGRGRVPARKGTQIFRSAFFTRRNDTIGPLIARIVTQALRTAQYCAWSYSSRGQASIPDVVRRVVASGGRVIASFATAHRYHAQGRTDRRTGGTGGVDEYLVLFGRGAGITPRAHPDVPPEKRSDGERATGFDHDEQARAVDGGASARRGRRLGA